MLSTLHRLFLSFNIQYSICPSNAAWISWCLEDPMITRSFKEEDYDARPLQETRGNDHIAPLSAVRENQVAAILGPGAKINRGASPAPAAPRGQAAHSDFDFVPEALAT